MYHPSAQYSVRPWRRRMADRRLLSLVIDIVHRKRRTTIIHSKEFVSVWQASVYAHPLRLHPTVTGGEVSGSTRGEMSGGT